MSAWAPYVRCRLGTRVKLFCFPYAGGGASIFLPWAEQLGDEVGVWAIQLPGRENRIREAYPTSVAEIARAIAVDGTLPFDGTFAFFGHSLGTLIAYEVAQSLRRFGRAEPARLLMSAHRAPQIPSPRAPTWNLPDLEFQQRLTELNGTPRAVLADRDLRELILPRMRADIRLDETYAHSATDAPLACPITAFGGTRDAETPTPHLEAWRHMTGGPFELRMFEGDHFFIHSHRTSLVDAVKEALRAH